MEKIETAATLGCVFPWILQWMEGFLNILGNLSLGGKLFLP